MAEHLRRRGGRADGSTLQEPLLEQDRQNFEPTSDEPSSSASAVVPHSINRLDWEQLLQTFVTSCHSGLQSLWATLASCFASLRGVRPAQLTPQQAQRLEELLAHMREDFDPGNPSHQEALHALWALAFPGEPYPHSGKSKRWTDMGWQRDDPTSDFRGGGLFSLQLLLSLGQDHPGVFKQLLDKSQGQRSEWEYPFGAAGVNLTFLLQEVMGLRDKRTRALATSSQLALSAAARGFVFLLGEEPQAFPEVYCMAFELLDQQWLEMRASYMDFPAVLSRVRSQLESALNTQPPSLQTLRQLLLS